MRALFFLSVVFLTSTTSLLAQTSSPRPSQPPRHGSWLGAMEASMHAVRVPDAERVILSQGTPTMGVFAWLGWAVALTFLLVLLFFHVRLKRRERSLLRGAEDLLLLPSPSRRHRSR